MTSGQSREDEAYEQGVRDGQKADLMDQFSNSLAKGFTLNPRLNAIYQKGYQYGLAHRPVPQKPRDAEEPRPNRAQRSELTSDESNGAELLGKLIGVLIVVGAIVWFVLAVAIPMLVINIAALALVAGVARKEVRRFLLPVSIAGAVLVLIDYNRGWFTKSLSENVPFFARMIQWFVYLNIVAGLIAAYFLIRDLLDSKTPQAVGAGEFSQRNLLTMGCLVIVGGLTVTLQTKLGIPQFGELTAPSSLVEGDRKAAPRAVGSFAVTLPHGQNLRALQEQPTDVLLGIDGDGRYYLNRKPVADSQLGPGLEATFNPRTGDRVMSVYADGDVDYSKILFANELAAKSGVCAVALIAEQQPGTVSVVLGDDGVQKNPATLRAVELQLPLPSSPIRSDAGNDQVFLEVATDGYRINSESVDESRLGSRLKEIFDPRPVKSILMKGSPDVKYRKVVHAIDVARGAGVIIIGVPANALAIPKLLPDIDLSRAATSPDGGGNNGAARCRRDSEQTAGAVATGVVGGRGPVSADQPYFEFQVEKQVQQIQGVGNPRYPEMLRSANVEGEVLAQFVVDADGRFEPGSFKVIKSSHDLFTQAVRSALPDMRFYPAEVGGKKVRQLVQQPFVFSPRP